MRREVVAALAAAVVVGLSATAITVYLAARDDGRPALTTEALTAYQEAVLPHLREGGGLVEQGMKPAATELAKATGKAAARIASDATGWADALGQIRANVAAVPTPEPLREAATGFDRALARYVDAARQFGTAARTPLPQRAPVLANGYEIAHDADTLYDAASAVIQRWRRRLGLAPTTDFPDPESPTPSPDERS